MIKINKKVLCLVIIVAIVVVVYNLTTVKLHSDDKTWSAVFLNAEGQFDGSWEGYLVYENSEEFSLDNIYVEIQVDKQKSYKGEIEYSPENVTMSQFRRITLGSFKKQMFCFLTFGKRPKSVDIKVYWKEGDVQKETVIKYT